VYPSISQKAGLTFTEPSMAVNDFPVEEFSKTFRNFSSLSLSVAFDTIEWDCGVDLDPEFVMLKSLPLQASSR
jgi:hypothetical protein